MSQHEKKLGSIKYGDADTVGNSQNTRSSVRQVKNSKAICLYYRKGNCLMKEKCRNKKIMDDGRTACKVDGLSGVELKMI